MPDEPMKRYDGYASEGKPAVKPTVGRIVLYYDFGAPMAAIVTFVYYNDSQSVDLTVFAPGVTFFEQGVAHRGRGTAKYWDWPPRE